MKNVLKGIVGVCVLFVLGFFATHLFEAEKPGVSLSPFDQNVPAQARVASDFGNVPLYFEPNVGQSDDQVDFISRGQGYTLFLTDGEAVLSLVKPQAEDESSRQRDVLRIQLLDANAATAVRGQDVVAGKSNYFIGNEPEKWHTEVPHYAKVKYDNVYQGIDLVYYGTEQNLLEHDFVVSPGADPDQIRFAVAGAQEITLDDTGNLIAETEGGDVILQAPVTYQEIDGKRIAVDSRYALLDGSFGFELGDYDDHHAVVIDPVLSYSTYLGGSGTDIAREIAVDASDNAYLAGVTTSTDFPTQTPFQGSHGGASDDVFVAAFNSSGGLIYSTYLGGTGDDLARDIDVDASGNAYVVGEVRSTDFPTQSPIQGSFSGGGYDGFVAKLNSTGSALVYSTYWGGSGGDIVENVAVDGSGKAYVTGLTGSTSGFPLNAAYQGTHASPGTGDAFVSVFNATGTSTVYSTYLGGGDADFGWGIAADAAGNAYVTGSTRSTNFPTQNPVQGSHGSGAGTYDAFVAIFNNTGSHLLYSTFLGGNGFDEGWSIAVNGSGDVYVTGNTASTNFTTVSPFQGSYGGGAKDVFVSAIDTLSGFIYSTYLGGSGDDYGHGIVLDGTGQAHVAGYTTSSNYPLQSPFQSSYGGSTDAFVTIFNSAGTSLVNSTYFGGSGIEVGQGIALDSSNNAIITGYVTSTDFPVASAAQSSFGGGTYDAFATKFGPSPFNDVAASAGVNSSTGDLGLAWADYDGDGDQDVYIASRVANKLYRNNNNGTFTDVASGAGLAYGSLTNSVAWVDYDNDGDLDVYAANGNLANVLYQNNGSGVFSAVSGQMADTGNGSGQAWADFDKDGDIDVFFGNFGPSANRLYQNNGDGTFTDIAGSTGLNSGTSTAGSAWGDYDNDGDPDLYVVHVGSSNQFYRNDGSSTFVNVTGTALVGDSGNGRGVLWGDTNNDGDPDLYVINDGSANKMYENNGNGTFTSTGGVEENTGSGTGGSFGDYDNDGDLELHLVRYNVSNILYDNDGTGSFTDITSSTGVGDSGKGFDGHFVDYDNDGDQDIYVVNDGDANALFRNDSVTGNWLHVDLTGTTSPDDAMGAQIDVRIGATTLRRWVDTGSGYNAQPPHLVHFGLGSATSVDSLIVTWSSGIVQDRTNLSINQIYALTEADEAFVSIPDVTASYSSSVQVPIRIDQDISGKNVVAAEISVTFDNSVVTLGSPDKTEIVGSMVASGWSVEENVFAGVGGIDTLSIAMSTAADTLSGTGDLIYIKFDVANIRHPASTPLNLVSVLFNEGSPSGVTTDGSLTIIGTDGSIVAAPDSINPADVVTVTITDADFDVDVGSADQVTATAVSKVYGDTETVTLTETGVNTGVFTGTLNTLFSLVADPSQNGTLGTVAGDSICVSYVDSLDSAGATVTRQDTVEVIGGTDGVVVTTYVVQAFDGRNGVRDTVRVEVADADLDTDVGVAEQVSATITNAISGEIEGVTLTETGLNTGVFQVRVPTIAGASGTNNDGELSLASWDTLDVSYNDALSSQGGANVVQEITRVVNLFGDVRVNDQVQAFDAARLLAISVGLISSNTQTTLVGDVDGNNSIQAFDASRVLQYVVRLINRFGVQTDFTADPKNHPFEKPVPLGNVIALGELEAQGDGTFLLPVSLSEREGILSGTLTLGVDAGVEVVDVDLSNDYGSFMVAHNMTTEGLKVAFAGSQSEWTGSGDVLMLKVRGVEGSPIRLSLDHVVLNGQTLTPSVNIEAMEEVITQAPELITELHQNIPNPFNPQTTIKYAIAEAGQVEMVIYSVTGQRIRTLISEFQDVGSYQIVWDGKDAVGRDVSSGVYLMRMQSTGFVQTKKMMLLR